MFLRYRTGSLSKMLARSVISHDCQSKSLFAHRLSVQSVEPSLQKFSQPEQILGFKWMHQQEKVSSSKEHNGPVPYKDISSQYRAVP